MEGLIPLIIIIAIVNLVNALLKASRGGRKSSGDSGTTPPPITQERNPLEALQALLDEQSEQVDPWAFDVGSNRDVDNSYINQGDLDKGIEEALDEGISDDITFVSVENDGPSEQVQRQKSDICKDDVTRTRLEKLFSDRDDLVAAYIFHEIIEPPLSIRRRH